MKSFNDWMNEGREWEGFRFFNRRVVCFDGYSISIQANNAAYCQPRDDIEDIAGYDSFELGFPSEADKSILDYAENGGNPVDTVYPYVPRDVVERLIEDHGGIKEFASKAA
uniref:hypothetical protein n=1 Tax=Enterobacter sp. TaxID=42895 RepID=UPI00296FEA9B|nr:hypothetical protein [Enterobacter sp.]